jgi:hypothetical protein
MLQQIDLQEHQLYIEKWLAAFCVIQAAYMPEAACFLAVHPPNDCSDSWVETQTLLLPSQLPPSVKISSLSLADMEQKLQYAQASDAIAELCQSLMVCVHLTKYKHDEVHGQHSNT